MKRITHFLRLIHRPLIGWLAVALVVIGLGVGLSVRDAQNRKADEAKALAALTKQQKAKSEKAAKPDQHFDEQGDALFKDVTDTDFTTASCGRLKNRAAIVITSKSCEYKIRALGKTKMAVVFVTENSNNQFILPYYDSLTWNNPGSKDSLVYLNTYLKEQAARYNVSNPPEVEMTHYGPYVATSSIIASGLYFNYQNNAADIMKVFSDTSKANKVPEDQYDMVYYVLLNTLYGGASMPGEHRAFTYNSSTVPIFVHETLHLFGASDKYNGCAYPNADIMCSKFDLNNSVINSVTAREIGWEN